jgi:hypothetical protein
MLHGSMTGPGGSDMFSNYPPKWSDERMKPTRAPMGNAGRLGV